MRILIINGPNINMLGIREPDVYGKENYAALCRSVWDEAEKLGISIELYQSNHEGCIVDKIQSAYKVFDGIIINPAAYSHTSIAILDALKAVSIPTVEVHLTDIASREEFRRFSYVSLVAEKTISGKGFDGYREALIYFSDKFGNDEKPL